MAPPTRMTMKNYPKLQTVRPLEGCIDDMAFQYILIDAGWAEEANLVLEVSLERLYVTHRKGLSKRD